MVDALLTSCLGCGAALKISRPHVERLVRCPGCRKAFSTKVLTSGSPSGRNRIETAVSALRAGAPVLTPATAEFSLPRSGEFLAGRRIVRKLGRGGMGVVYEGESPDDRSRVALKVIAPEMLENGGEIARRRFVIEVRAAAKVRHPNVVAMSDVVEDRGAVIMVMELVDGGSAADLSTPEKPCDPLEATRIIRLAAEGLEAVHAAGIVHRDVKPANILLGKGGAVKIADFGMAKVLGAGGMSLTDTGQTVGTPQYMSPEQCTGSTLDARSDVYSLGASYFRLLAGRSPFEGAESLVILNRQISEPPPDLTRIGVPGLCARIVDRALKKDPARRFQSAREMAAALLPVEIALRRDAEIAAAAEKGNDSASTMVLDERAVARMLEDDSDEGSAPRDLPIARTLDDDSEADEALLEIEGDAPNAETVHGGDEDDELLRAGSEVARMLADSNDGLPTPPVARIRPPRPTQAAGAAPAKSSAPASSAPARSVTVSARSRTAGPDTPPSDEPENVTLKLRFDSQEDARKGLGFLRSDVRSVSRKVIAPSLWMGRKTAVLDVSVCLPPDQALGVGKSLICAGGTFLSARVENNKVREWLQSRLSAVRKT